MINKVRNHHNNIKEYVMLIGKKYVASRKEFS